MKDKILSYVDRYKENPGWYWLIATIFLFPILPEYISPIFLFIGFVVFKIQWSNQGNKARLGTPGKMMLFFLGIALISTLWSNTKFSTFATVALWWGMFLVQIMIYNLARSRRKIDIILKTMVLSGAINGAMGGLQIGTYTLNKFYNLPPQFVVTTPFYKNLDYAIYNALPFNIVTDTFDDRASGFFSNPNLLASYLLVVYPISIYLFINTKKKIGKVCYFIMNVLITIGISSTLTRAGCFIAIAGWLIMFIILFKRHYKALLGIFVPTIAIIIPSLLTRYGVIFTEKPIPIISDPEIVANSEVIINSEPVREITEAEASTTAHLQIWSSLIDYLTHNIKAFFIGTGFGIEETGNILSENYDLFKPHAHNFIIEIWMEIGVIGVLLLLAIIICCFGKLLEINANNGRKFTLVFCVFTAMITFFTFGLTDYIFNSPKQIIIFFILIGLTQAISATFDKTIIKDPSSLIKVAENNIKNTINQ